MRKPFPSLLLLVSLAVLASYGVFMRSSPFASPQISESASPQVMAKASRKAYIVGEPISINYRVVNEGRSEIYLDNGYLSKCDSRLCVTVRNADGTIIPSTVCYTDFGKDLPTSDRLRPPDTLVINDMVPIARPGLYRVTIYVDINPAGSVGDESHCTVTIRMVDTPQARAKRKARIAFAAKTLHDANASAQAKSNAISDLEYNNEPEALPVLLDAYTSSDGNIRAAAYVPLTMWHEQQVAWDAADTRMKSLTRDKKLMRESEWQVLLDHWESLGGGRTLTGN